MRTVRLNFESTADKVSTQDFRSYAAPTGLLTKPGMENFEGDHQTCWAGIEVAFK